MTPGIAGSPWPPAAGASTKLRHNVIGRQHACTSNLAVLKALTVVLIFFVPSVARTKHWYCASCSQAAHMRHADKVHYRCMYCISMLEMQ